MLAFRSLARSVPRATPQLTARPATRHLQQFRIQSLISPLRSLSPTSRFVAPFSSSSRQLQDDALAVKLAQELKVETDLRKPAAQDEEAGYESLPVPNDFEISDSPGVEEVVLTKKHNGETIRVAFNIRDLHNEVIPSDPDETYGEEEDIENVNEPLVNQQNDPKTTNQIASEDQIEQNEVPDNYDGEQSFPVKFEITIEKDGKPGALVVDCVAQDGEVMVDNFFYVKDAALARPTTFDAQQSRDSKYGGPPFGELDDELQSLFNQYLADRGIDAILAEFATNYIDSKEQKEYINWLEEVKEFVE